MKHFYIKTKEFFSRTSLKIVCFFLLFFCFNLSVSAQKYPKPDLLEISDTGRKNDDNITKDISPFFQGQVKPNAIVNFYSKTKGLLFSTVADAKGGYKLQLEANPSRLLEDGVHELYIKEELAGLEGQASDTLVFTLDTTVPDVPKSPDLHELSDSGFSGEDNITNDTIPVFTGKTEPKAIISVFDGEESVGSHQVDSIFGRYAIRVIKPILHGLHQVSVTATDVAGNTSAKSTALALEIDTELPANPSKIDIPDYQDSGKYNDDDTTNIKKLNFLGTKTFDTRTIIWESSGKGKLDFGLFDLLMNFHRDYNKTFDTLSVEYPEFLVDMPKIANDIPKEEADTLADWLRSERMKYFREKARGSLSILVDTLIGEEISQAIEYDKLGELKGEGEHILKTISIDRAGNYSVSVDSTIITIDTKAPDSYPNLITDSYYTNDFIERQAFLDDAAFELLNQDFRISYFNDSTSSIQDLHEKGKDILENGIWHRKITEHIDNYTNVFRPRFIDELEERQKLSFKLLDSKGGELYDLEIDLDDLKKSNDPEFATYFPAFNYTHVDSLADGSYQIVIKNTDIAGNEYEDFLDFTIDNTAPLLSQGSIIDADDTGMQNDDELTEKTTFSLEGEAEAKSNVEVWYDNQLVGYDTTTISGAYQVNLKDSLVALPDGEHQFITKAYDSANNEAINKFIKTIVRTLPQKPSIRTSLLETNEDEAIEISIKRDSVNVPAVNYFKITDLGNAKITFAGKEIKDGDFLEIPAGSDSLKLIFLPNQDLHTTASSREGKFSFKVWASKSSTEDGLKQDLVANRNPKTTESVLVKVKVLPVNDAPEFTAETISLYEDEENAYASTAWVSNIASGPTMDLESESYAFSIVNISDSTAFKSLPTFRNSITGDLVFELREHYFGSIDLKIRLKDEGGVERNGIDTLIQTLKVVVTPTPDNPHIVYAGDTIENNNLRVLEDGVEVFQDREGKDSLVYNPIEFGIFKSKLDQAEIIGFILNERLDVSEERGDLYYLDTGGNKRLVYDDDFISLSEAENMLFVPTKDLNDDQAVYDNVINGTETDLVPRFNIIAVMNKFPSLYEKSKEIENARIIIEPINDIPEFVVSDRSIDVQAMDVEKSFHMDTVVNRMFSGGGEDERSQSFNFIISNEQALIDSAKFTSQGLPKITQDLGKATGNMTFTLLPHVLGRVVVKFVMEDNGLSNALRGDINRSVEDSVIINIQKPDYKAPTNIALNPDTIRRESLASTKVGEITWTDLDRDDTHQLELVSGDGDTHNAYFEILSEKELYSKQDLPEFLNLSELNIRVKVTDSHALDTEQTLSVRLVEKEIKKASKPLLSSNISFINEDASFDALALENKIFKFSEGIAPDDDEVSHFYLSEIENGKLHFLNNEEEVDTNFPITKAQAQDGLVFVPSADYFGTGSFSIQAAKDNNAKAISDSLKVSFEIRSVNDQPTLSFSPDTIRLEEDFLDTVSRSFSLSEVVLGPQNEARQSIQSFTSLTFDASYFQNEPVLSLGDSTIQFSLKENAHGTTLIQFKLKDDGGVESSGVDSTELLQIVLEIKAKADKPIVSNPHQPDPLDPTNNELYHFITDEDQSFTFTEEIIQRNAVDGDEVAFVKISDIKNGSIQYGEQNITEHAYVPMEDVTNLKFIPSADYFGKVAFSIQATTVENDDNVLSELDTIKGLVNPVNDKPSFEVNAINITSSRTIFEYQGKPIHNLNMGGLTDLEDYQEGDLSYSVALEDATQESLFFEGELPSLDSNAKLSFLLKANPPVTVIGLKIVLNDGETTNNLSDTVSLNIIISEGNRPETEDPEVLPNPTGTEFWEMDEDTTLEGIKVKAPDSDENTQLFYISSVSHGKLFAKVDDGEKMEIKDKFISKGQALSGLTFIPDANYFNVSETDPAGFTINGVLEKNVDDVRNGTFVRILVHPINDLPSFESVDTIKLIQNFSETTHDFELLSLINNGAENEAYQLASTEVKVDLMQAGEESNFFVNQASVKVNTIKASAKLNFTLSSGAVGTGMIVYSLKETGNEFQSTVKDTVFVQVSREPNYVPEGILLSPNEVIEQQASGTFVGVLSTEDKNQMDTYSYDLVAGAGDENNAYFYIEGDNLFTSKKLYYDDADFYFIRVKSTDDRGEFVEESLEIEIISNPKLELIIPNAFTPNNDFENDTWEIGNLRGHKDASVKVFNNRGKLVFSAKGIDKAWDGAYNGEVLPKGSYYYVIQLNDEESKLYKGIVSILK